MSIRPTSLLALILLCAAIGCGLPDRSVPDEPMPPMAPPFVAGPELRARIEEAKAYVLSDTCFQEDPDASRCDWGDFPFRPEEFVLNKSTGEAILIVDTFSALPPRAIRYKNRIKNFFRVDSEGNVAPVASSWRAPTRLFKVLSSFASPDVIPAQTLRPLHEALDKVYGFYSAGSAGHGSYVFSLLVEANPQQPFVLLDNPTLQSYALTELCDTSGAPEILDRLRARSQRVADELRRLMRELNVRFVNLSSGLTLPVLRADWMAHCKGPLPGDEVLRAKMNAYAPIMDALFNTEGVFTAHAATNASKPLDQPFDLPSSQYPNRLRVGYLTVLDSGLDGQGRGDHRRLTGSPGPISVDIYLNSGVLPQRPFPHNRTPLLQVDEFGTNTLPISQTATSWIAPLALSRFIHARYTTAPEKELSDALIAHIKNVMTPAVCADLPGDVCIYQDPLRNGQTEAQRLGYVPLEYDEP